MSLKNCFVDWLHFWNGFSFTFWREKQKKNWTSVGLPSDNFYSSPYSITKERGELKFMQLDIGFLSYYCMWGSWVSEILLNHLQDPKEDADKILSKQWFSCSFDVHKHIFPSYNEELVCSFSFSWHICCQISLWGRDPFSLRASHHYLLSCADLLPNDPLPFHFIENCLIPAVSLSFQFWVLGLISVQSPTSLFLPDTQGSLKPFFLSSAPTRHSSCMEKPLLT